jgi:hypothetical protein
MLLDFNILYETAINKKNIENMCEYRRKVYEIDYDDEFLAKTNIYSLLIFIFFNYTQFGSNTISPYYIYNSIFSCKKVEFYQDLYMNTNLLNTLKKKDSVAAAVFDCQGLATDIITKFKTTTETSNFKDYFKKHFKFKENVSNVFIIGLSHHTMTLIIKKNEASKTYKIAFINAGYGSNYNSNLNEDYNEIVNGIIIFNKIYDWNKKSEVDITENLVKEYISEILLLHLIDKNETSMSKLLSINNTLELFYQNVLGQMCGIDKNINSSDSVKYLLQKCNKKNIFTLKIFKQLSGSCSATGPFFTDIFNNFEDDDQIKLQKRADSLIIEYFDTLLDIYENSLDRNSLYPFIDNINKFFKLKLTVNNIIFVIKEKIIKMNEYYNKYFNDDKKNLSVYNEKTYRILEKLYSIDIKNDINILNSKNLNYIDKTFKFPPVCREITPIKMIDNFNYDDIQRKYKNFLKSIELIKDFQDLYNFIIDLNHLIKSFHTYGTYNKGTTLFLFINVTNKVYKLLKVEKNIIKIHNCDIYNYNSNKNLIPDAKIKEFYQLLIKGKECLLYNLIQVTSMIRFDVNELLAELPINPNTNSTNTNNADPNNSLIYEIIIIYYIFIISLLFEPQKSDSDIDEFYHIDIFFNIQNNIFFRKYFKYLKNKIEGTDYFPETFTSKDELIKLGNNQNNKINILRLDHDINVETIPSSINYLFNFFNNDKLEKIKNDKYLNIYGDKPIYLFDSIFNLFLFYSAEYNSSFIDSEEIENKKEFDEQRTSRRDSLAYTKIKSRSINDLSLNKIIDFINKFIENPTNEIDITIDLFYPYLDFNKKKDEDVDIELFKTNSKNNDYSKIFQELIFNNKKFIEEFNKITYDSNINIKNLINLGILMHLTDKKLKNEDIITKIKLLNNKLDTSYGDQIKLLNYLLLDIPISYDEVIQIFNKYNIYPNTSNYKYFTGVQSNKKLNNRFSNNQKKLINSMLLKIFSKLDINSDIIKNYYDSDNKFQKFYFNYNNINNNFYNELDDKDKFLNLEFQKINNYFYSHDNYVLIRNPYIIENMGIIGDVKKTPNLDNECKKKINKFIEKYFHQKDTSWDIINKLRVSTCDKKESERLIYIEDNLKNIYMIGYINDSNEMFSFINNINDVQESEWVLLKIKKNMSYTDIIDKLIFKYIIDIPYFNNNYNFIISNNKEDIEVESYKQNKKIYGCVKIKLTGGFYLIYNLQNKGDEYYCDSQEIFYGNDKISNRINSQEILKDISEKLKNYVINLILNVENPSNIIIWNYSDCDYYYLCSFNTLLIIDGQKLELINNNNKYLIHEDFSIEKECFNIYHFITNPYCLVSIKTYKLIEITADNKPIYDIGEDEKLLFTFGSYSFEEIDNINFFKTSENDTWLGEALKERRKRKIIDSNYMYSEIKPSNSLYINKIHNSNLFLIFEELESSLFYLYSYFKYNHSFFISDIFDVIIKLLFKKMDDDYSINGINEIDNKYILNSEKDKQKYNIPKLLIKLSAMIYNNPESLVFNNLLISIYYGSNLHTCTSEILKILLKIDYKIMYIQEVFYSISDDLKTKYSNYIKNLILVYDPLYRNLYSKLFNKARLLEELRNNKINNLIAGANSIGDVYFNSSKQHELIDQNNKYDIFSHYLQKFFIKKNIAKYFYNIKDKKNNYFWIIDGISNIEGEAGIFIFGDINSEPNDFQVDIKENICVNIHDHEINITNINNSEYLIFKKFLTLAKSIISEFKTWAYGPSYDADNDILSPRNIDKTKYEDLFEYYENINLTDVPSLSAKDEINRIHLFLYKKYLSQNMAEHSLMMFDEDGNLSNNEKFEIFSKIPSNTSDLLSDLPKNIEDDYINKFNNDLITKLNEMDISEKKETQIKSTEVDVNILRKLNSYLEINKLEITLENKYKIKKFLILKLEEFKKEIFVSYTKLITKISLKNKMNIKNYFIENFNDNTKFIGLTTLYNNIKYILSTSLKIEIPTEVSKNNLVDLNLDVFASLRNLAFGKYIEYNTTSGKCTFIINDIDKSQIKNKLRFLIEFTFGIIRKDQIDLLKDIIKNIDHIPTSEEKIKKNPYHMYQAIMAAGKTAVLTPYLALYYYCKGEKMMIVTLSTLIQTTFENLLNIGSLLFTIPIFELKFTPTKINKNSKEIYISNDDDRNNKNTIKPSNIFNENNRLIRGVYILSDLEYKISILNNEKFRFMHLYDKDGKEIVKEFINEDKIDIYKEYKESVIIMDEVDDILDVVKSELNYPKSFDSGRNDIQDEIDKSDKANKVNKQIINFLFNLSYKIFNNEFISSPDFNVDSEHIVRIKDNKSIYNNTEQLLQLIKENFDITQEFKFIGDESIESKENKIIEYIKNIPDLNIQNILYTIINDDINKIKDMIPNRNYGLANSNDYKEIKEFPKTEFIAIPYDGLRKPAYGSEFSNVYLTILLTYFIYFINGLSYKSIVNCLIVINETYLYLFFKINGPTTIISEKENKIAKEELETLKENYLKLKELLPKLNLPDNIIYLNDKISVIKEKQDEKDTFLMLKDETKNLFKLFIDVNISKYIKISDANYNISSNDIIQRNITSKLAGYTGTLYIKDIVDVITELETIKKAPFPTVINKLQPKDMVDGEIYASLLGKKINVGISYFYIPNYDRTNSILNTVTTKDYRAIIDVGSLFYNHTNDDIAKIWKFYLHNNNKKGYVLYLDNKNKKHVYNISQNKDQKEDFDPIKHKKDQLYVYFDQAHITGIDIKLPIDIKGLVTVSENTNLRDLAQGSYRLREIKSGQKFNIILSESAKIKIDLNLPDFTGSSTNGDSTHPDKFLKWILENQEKQDKNKESTYKKQSLRTYTRLALLNNTNIEKFYTDLKQTDKFKELINIHQSNYNISPYCLITKIPKIVQPIINIEFMYGIQRVSFNKDPIMKTLDEYMIEEHLSILELIEKLENYPFSIAKSLSRENTSIVETSRSQDKQVAKEKSKEKEKEKLQNRSKILSNKLDNLKPDNLELEIIEILPFKNYFEIQPTKEKIELIDSDIKIPTVNTKYYNMFISYFKNTTENPELEFLPLITGSNKIVNLFTLINKFFTNFVPIIPGINLSKFIYNNNKDMLKAKDEVKHLVSSSAVIFINEHFKQNIFIISLSEYLNLKDRTPGYIKYFSLVGKPFKIEDELKDYDLRKVLIIIIALINGKFLLYELENEKFGNLLQSYFCNIDYGRNFINLFYKKLLIQYQLNNNYYDDINIPKFQTSLDAMEKEKKWQKKYLKYKMKYLQLKNQII